MDADSGPVGEFVEVFLREQLSVEIGGGRDRHKPALTPDPPVRLILDGFGMPPRGTFASLTRSLKPKARVEAVQNVHANPPTASIQLETVSFVTRRVARQ